MSRFLFTPKVRACLPEVSGFSKMMLWLLCVLLFTFPIAYAIDVLSCTTGLTQNSECSSIGHKANKTAESADFLELCGLASSTLKCGKSIPEECFKLPELSGLANIGSVMSQMAAGCQENQKAVAEVAECLKKDMGSFGTCYDIPRIQKLFEESIMSLQLQEMSPTICCEFVKGEGCYHKTAESMCGQEVMGAVQTVDSFIYKAFGCNAKVACPTRR